MIERAVIIVKGHVQRVGYRDAVERIAQDSGIGGYVENLKPYDVRIVCEGEKEDLEGFIEQIKIQESPVFVEDIEVKFEKPTGEFEYFEIKRGVWHEELGERLDFAGKFLYKTVELGEKNLEIGEKMLEKQDTMIEKQDTMIEKQDTMIEKQDKTIGSIENLRTDVGQRFDILDMKYGEISKNLVNLMDRFDRLLEKSDRDREEFGKHMDRLITALIESRK